MKNMRKCTHCDTVKELTTENFRGSRWGLLWVCRSCKGPRFCAENGCTKTNPIYGLDKCGEKYCYIHGIMQRGLRNTKSRRCEHPECSTQPVYNFPGEAGGRYCSSHAEDGMVNVKDRRCEYPSCRTIPNYNFPGEAGGRYCSSHAEDGMVNVKCRQCEHPGCSTQPAYNFPWEIGGRYCRKHTADGMVNVVSIRCEHPECSTQPSYNFPGEIGGRYCRTHALENMVYVNKLCENACCTKQPSKGYSGNSAVRCGEHTLPGMISYPKTRCTFRDEFGNKCRELALYGISRALHCETHCDPTEINLIEQTCVSCGLITVVDPLGVCGYCDPTNQARARLAKQRIVQAFLDRRIEAGDIPDYDSYDSQLDRGSCGRERPDFLWDCGGWCVILEVDEEQHNSRQENCEVIRMKNIAHSLGGPRVWFLRYNPDPYRTNGKQNPTLNTRHKTLLRTLKRLFSEAPPETDFITASYLYYDGYTTNGQTDITIESMAVN